MSQALSEVLVTFSHDVLMMLGGPGDIDKKSCGRCDSKGEN